MLMTLPELNGWVGTHESPSSKRETAALSPGSSSLEQRWGEQDQEEEMFAGERPEGEHSDAGKPVGRASSLKAGDPKVREEF